MKKILLSLSLVVFSLATMAQNSFTNPGFENWSGSMPTGWSSIGVAGFNLSDISKSTTSHSGNYSVAIAAKPLSPLVVGTIESLLDIELPDGIVIPGMLTNGTINLEAAIGFISELENIVGGDLSNLDIAGLLNILDDGVALTHKPTNVKGHLQWNPINPANEGYILATFVTKMDNNGEKELLGFGIHPTDILGKENSKSGFTSFDIPIIYTNPNADTEELMFVAIAYAQEEQSSYTKLLLDDLIITDNVSVQSLSLEDNATTLYPNPSNGSFMIDIDRAEVSVVNALGQEILPWKEYSRGSQIEIENKGVYFVRIKTDNKIQSEKLIVN